MKIWALELSFWILLYSSHMWNSHRFELGYCLNKSMGSDPPIGQVDKGLSWSQYSAQIFPRNLEDNRMEHYVMFSNTRDAVTNGFFHCRVCWFFVMFCVCWFFLNAQLFQSPQKPNSIWRSNAAAFTNFNHLRNILTLQWHFSFINKTWFSR